GNGEVVETRPSVFPAVEMRHPVRNVYIDSVNSGCGNLPDALHVSVAPRLGVGTDPDIFVTWPDPECCTRGKESRFAGDLALDPIGMVFHHGMCGFVCIRGNAFGAGDVDEGFVSRGVRALRNRSNRR